MKTKHQSISMTDEIKMQLAQSPMKGRLRIPQNRRGRMRLLLIEPVHGEEGSAARPATGLPRRQLSADNGALFLHFQNHSKRSLFAKKELRG